MTGPNDRAGVVAVVTTAVDWSAGRIPEVRGIRHRHVAAVTPAARDGERASEDRSGERAGGTRGRYFFSPAPGGASPEASLAVAVVAGIPPGAAWPDSAFVIPV